MSKSLVSCTSGQGNLTVPSPALSPQSCISVWYLAKGAALSQPAALIPTLWQCTSTVGSTMSPNLSAPASKPLKYDCPSKLVSMPFYSDNIC